MSDAGLVAGRHDFRRDAYCRWGLGLHPLVLALVALLLTLTGPQSHYLVATVLLFGVPLLVLMALSVPRYVEIGAKEIRIVCLLEMTIIPGSEIRSVERVSRFPHGRTIPVVAMFGFGGYCGYFLSLRDWALFKMYATHRGECIVIRRYEGCDIVATIN